MKKEELSHQLRKMQDHKPTILGDFSSFAVMVPLIEMNHDTHILFEVRSKQMRSQPGEICFPGGRMEDEDFHEQQTAIRETCEELGLQTGDVTVIAPLDYVVTPFGTIIFPFVGKIHPTADICPNKDEVAETFTVPLSYLLSHEPDFHYVDLHPAPHNQFPHHLIPGGENYKWRVRKLEEYFYFYEDKVIWGLTARILKHFMDTLTKKEQ